MIGPDGSGKTNQVKGLLRNADVEKRIHDGELRGQVQQENRPARWRRLISRLRNG
jgi:hypothetical protein